MEKTLEIFAQFIRTHTNISSNIQDKFLVTAIRETFDIDLQETIGTKLFSHLIELIENDTIKQDEIMYKLLNYAKYFIAYTTVARLAVISSVKIDNIGISRTEDEKVRSLELTDVFSVEDYYYNKADIYKQRLQKFICAKNSYFSKWLTNNSIDELKANLYSAASSNIFLGGARSKYKKIKY